MFTVAEIDHLHVLAVERAAEREARLLRADREDLSDVILLEPYVVEGDDSLFLARIRRELDRGPLGLKRVLIGITPQAREDLWFARRQQDEFFRARSPGQPHDAPEFQGIDFLTLPQKLRPENLRNIFKAPSEKVAE